MFFIVGMSTFTWILLAYVLLITGVLGSIDFLGLKDITLESKVFTYKLNGAKFTIYVRELFLIIGSLALFIEVAKAATSKSFGGAEALLSFIVAVIFIVIFFSFEWASNPTFMILSMMSFIDATGGFLIELNAARRDFSVG